MAQTYTNMFGQRVTGTPGTSTGTLGRSAPLTGLRGAPAGMVWDATRGAYVSPTTQATDRTSNATATLAENEAARRAPNYIDPLEQARLNESSRAAQSMEALQKLGIDTSASTAAANLAETSRSNIAGETLATNKFNQTVKDRAAALAALDAMWGAKGTSPGIDDTGQTPEGPGGMGPGGQQPGGQDPYAYDSSAEDAAYTGARERVGRETAASLKALKGIMSSRGIGGSGIEARNTRDVVGQGMADLAGVNADLASGRANRAFDWQKTMAPIKEQGRQFDLTAKQRQKEFAASQLLAQQQTKLNALLGLYGVQY